MRSLQSLCWLVLTVASVASLAAAQAPADPKPDIALERVLGQMDSAATNFHTTEANVMWDEYQKVVDEHDVQKGKVYFPTRGK